MAVGRVSTLIHYAVIAICSVGVYLFLLTGLEQKPAENYQVKRQAAHLAARSHLLFGDRLIGEEYTPITTTLGSLKAKKLSIHPDFAAVAVEWMTEAGLRPGDTVAVNLSASFPGLNMSVLAAAQAMQLRPVITSSIGASTWGANRPELTWIDMESKLWNKGLISWRSAAVSLGGGRDAGQGLSSEGLKMEVQAIRRSGVTMIRERTLTDAIQRRLAIYRQYSGELPAALINVGGNQTFFGMQGHNLLLRQGLINNYVLAGTAQDGLAYEFLRHHRPIIHFINIQRIATRYGIADGQELGTASVYFEQRLPLLLRFMGGGWLLMVIAYLAYLKSECGRRIYE